MAFNKETGKKAGKKSKRGADTQLKELRNFYKQYHRNCVSLKNSLGHDPSYFLLILNFIQI